jgi:hypothetical protein
MMSYLKKLYYRQNNEVESLVMLFSIHLLFYSNKIIDIPLYNMNRSLKSNYLGLKEIPHPQLVILSLLILN